MVGTINCSFCGKLIAQLGADIRCFVEPWSMLRSAKGEAWQRVTCVRTILGLIQRHGVSDTCVSLV